jgi:death-on-curing protein
MTLRWLTRVGVEAIQNELITRYGGSYGVRDAGLLESALARGTNLHAYENEQSVPMLAAAISWGIVRNHAFIDGNKRAALAALITFLELNGWELTCTEAEETVMVLRAAAGEMKEQEWTIWVETASRQKLSPATSSQA